MPEVLKKPLPLSPIYQEFNIFPTGDFHNNLVGRIMIYLAQCLKDIHLTLSYDTIRYLDDWQINAFGDFKKGVQLENFIAGLRRFGATQHFIQSKLDEYTGMGTIHPGCAPDIFVVEKAERNNEFGIPLLAFEIISRQSREHDLWFKPFFYETIGVQEYFVGEPSIETGAIVRAYRLEGNRYHAITLESAGYYSKVLGHFLPREWEI
jgi:hypothetical protein